MKKLFKTLAIVLLASATTFASVTEDKKEVKQPKTFDIGMYNIKNTSTIRLMLEKAKGSVITVRLMSAEGETLYTETVNKNQTSYSANFQLQDLKDGTYHFEIENKNEKVIREVKVATNVPTPVVYKALTLN